MKLNIVSVRAHKCISAIVSVSVLLLVLAWSDLWVWVCVCVCVCVRACVRAFRWKIFLETKRVNAIYPINNVVLFLLSKRTVLV